MAAGGGGTRCTSEVKASLGRRVAVSFGEAGGGSALEQRETGERDDGKEMRRVCCFGGGGFRKIAKPFI